MSQEFACHTQKFSIQPATHSLFPSQLRILFEDQNQIRKFFERVMRDKIEALKLKKIAAEVVPSHSSRRHTIPRSDSELMEALCKQIELGQAVVSMHDGAVSNGSTVPGDDTGFFGFDFASSLESAANRIKEAASKLLNTDIHILEQTFAFDEKSDPSICPVVLDTASTQDHSTGWKSWDNPFEIAVFGAFKAVAAFRLSQFLMLGDSAAAAAALGAQSELMTTEYLVTGRSIVRKNWYGSYAIRYNVRRLTLELAWLKYKGCGPSERWLVELKRGDRFLVNRRVVYTHPSVRVPPFPEMDRFLADHKSMFPFPEYDITAPIAI